MNTIEPSLTLTANKTIMAHMLLDLVIVTDARPNDLTVETLTTLARREIESSLSFYSETLISSTDKHVLTKLYDRLNKYLNHGGAF